MLLLDCKSGVALFNKAHEHYIRFDKNSYVVFLDQLTSCNHALTSSYLMAKAVSAGGALSFWMKLMSARRRLISYWCSWQLHVRPGPTSRL